MVTPACNIRMRAARWSSSARKGCKPCENVSARAILCLLSCSHCCFPHLPCGPHHFHSFSHPTPHTAEDSLRRDGSCVTSCHTFPLLSSSIRTTSATHDLTSDTTCPFVAPPSATGPSSPLRHPPPLTRHCRHHPRSSAGQAGPRAQGSVDFAFCIWN
jgi:hypothetical protein